MGIECPNCKKENDLGVILQQNYFELVDENCQTVNCLFCNKPFYLRVDITYEFTAYSETDSK